MMYGSDSEEYVLLLESLGDFMEKDVEPAAREIDLKARFPKESMVVERVPDVFQSGHIHVPGTSMYRGTTIVNSGAWQGQTEYQKRTGLVPKPGLLPVVNLSSLEVRMMNFNTP